MPSFYTRNPNQRLSAPPRSYRPAALPFNVMARCASSDALWCGLGRRQFTYVKTEGGISK